MKPPPARKKARRKAVTHASIRKALHMKTEDSIVCAYPEYASGPGWSNQPLWVIVRDGDHKLRQECLQPQEQPAEIQLFLFRLGAEFHRQVVGLLTALTPEDA